MTHDRIRAAIDASLSGVSARPTLRYRVLSDIRGEQKVKKKLSLGLAQALLLLVLTVTTVTATTLSDLGSLPGDPTTLEQPTAGFSADPLSYWNDYDVILMAKFFLQARGEDSDAAFADMTQDNQAVKARQIVREYYADPETGGKWSWFSSHRLKALHCAMQVYHHCYDPEVLGGDFFLLPGEEDMSEAQAREAALDLLYDRFALPLDFEKNYDPDTAFVLEKDASEPVWRFWYETESGRYEAVLSRTGEWLRWTTPYTDVVYTKPEMLALPDDLPMGGDQDIIDMSRMALSEIGHYDRSGSHVALDPARIDAAEARASLIQRDDILHGSEPVWIIEFFYQDEILARVMRDTQGKYMGTAFGDMDFADTMK